MLEAHLWSSALWFCWNVDKSGVKHNLLTHASAWTNTSCQRPEARFSIFLFCFEMWNVEYVYKTWIRLPPWHDINARDWSVSIILTKIWRKPTSNVIFMTGSQKNHWWQRENIFNSQSQSLQSHNSHEQYNYDYVFLYCLETHISNPALRRQSVSNRVWTGKFFCKFEITSVDILMWKNKGNTSDACSDQELLKMSFVFTDMHFNISQSVFIPVTDNPTLQGIYYRLPLCGEMVGKQYMSSVFITISVSNQDETLCYITRRKTLDTIFA